MNNWCIYWFFTHILLRILIFKGLTARRLYKSFGVKGLNHQDQIAYNSNFYLYHDFSSLVNLLRHCTQKDIFNSLTQS
jgi:hypothetical protein